MHKDKNVKQKCHLCGLPVEQYDYHPNAEVAHHLCVMEDTRETREKFQESQKKLKEHQNR